MTSVCYNRENGKEDFLYEKMNFLAADRFSAVRLRSDAGRRIHHQQSGTDPDGIAGIRAYWQNELNEVKKRYPEAVEPDYIEDFTVFSKSRDEWTERVLFSAETDDEIGSFSFSAIANNGDPRDSVCSMQLF